MSPKDERAESELMHLPLLMHALRAGEAKVTSPAPAPAPAVTDGGGKGG